MSSGVAGQEDSIGLLNDAGWNFVPYLAPPGELVSLYFVIADLDLPAFVVEGHQLLGGEFVGVKEHGDKAMSFAKADRSEPMPHFVIPEPFPAISLPDGFRIESLAEAVAWLANVWPADER